MKRHLGHGGSRSRPGCSSSAPWVRINIAPAGRDDAQGAARAVGNRAGALFALMDGPVLLGTVHASDVSSDGRELSWLSGANLERICKKTSQRRLPPDLAGGGDP